MINILFVCNANVNRSPTFEKFFKKFYPKYDTRSAGTYVGYPHILNEKLMEWADKVFVMDLSQASHIKHNYPELYKKVEVVGISDQYDPDEPVLINLIEFWIGERGGFDK